MKQDRWKKSTYIQVAVDSIENVLAPTAEGVGIS